MSQDGSYLAGQCDICNSSSPSLQNEDNAIIFRTLRSLQRKITVQVTSLFLYTTAVWRTCRLGHFCDLITVRSLKNRFGRSDIPGLHYTWGSILLELAKSQANISESKKYLREYIILALCHQQFHNIHTTC